MSFGDMAKSFLTTRTLQYGSKQGIGVVNPDYEVYNDE